MVCIQNVLIRNTSAHAHAPILVNSHCISFNTRILEMWFKVTTKKLSRYWMHTQEVHLVILILRPANFSFPTFGATWRNRKGTLVTLEPKLILCAYLKERKIWNPPFYKSCSPKCLTISWFLSGSWKKPNQMFRKWADYLKSNLNPGSMWRWIRVQRRI